MAWWCYEVPPENYISHKDIQVDTITTLEDDDPALWTAQKWTTDFSKGNESLEVEPRPGHPPTAAKEENINSVTTGDGCQAIEYEWNSHSLSITSEIVENLLHNELGMKNISARCEPRLLRPDQKQNLLLFEADEAGFLESFLAQDKR